MTKCLSAAEFADYLAGSREHGPHVRACARCRMLANALQTAEALPDLDATMEELRRRQEESARAIEELEASRPDGWPQRAGSDPRLHRPESIRRLLVRANEVYPSAPRRALALARCAAIGAAAGVVSSALRLEVLKDLANFLLRADDDIAGAEHALNEAQALVFSTDDPLRYAAILDHARAYLYGDATCARWDDALQLLDRCEPIFRVSDDRRWRSVRHLRASVLLRASRYEEGAVLYADLLATETDAYTIAILRSDLAHCCLHTGREAEAAALAEEALTVLASSERTIAMALTMLIHGEALSLLGRHEEAIPELSAVSRIFASAGLRDDELRAELAVVRAERAADPTANVASRLEAAYLLACALDEAQPLRSGAIRAAVWAEISSAYERNALTAAVLAHAADFMRTVGRGDEAAFSPLQ